MKLRRLARPLLLFSLALCLLLAAALPARAAVDAVSRITVTVYGDPASCRGFAWHTAPGLTGSDLQVVPDRGAATDYSTPLSFTGRSGVAGNDASTLWHKVEARGLAPDTTYRFRVGDAARSTWSPWGSFRTAGSGGFTFIALTDTQAASRRDAEISANTLAVAMTVAPDAVFAVHSGDVVDKGLDETQWQQTLDAARDSLLHMTLVPAAGNHERSGGAFYEHFNLDIPRGCDTASGAYYSFTWGPAHFVTLNTNEPSGAITFMGDSQIAWLEQTVASARQAGALTTVVNIHKGMYSLGPYATDSTVTGAKGLRSKLAPLLERLEVALVLQGHDHFPSRTHPLRGGSAAANGTVYLNTCTAGVKSYSRNPDVTADYLSRFDFVSRTEPSYTRYQNFAVITVDSRGGMAGVMYEIDQQRDPKAPYVVDRFAIGGLSAGSATPFWDLGASVELTDAVNTVCEAGIMEGVGGGRFDPDSQLNRATLVTLLHRLAGKPDAARAGSFSDVPAGQWYSEAVAWAAGEGYVSGYGDGTFGPLNNLSREQLAAVLYRYAEQTERTGLKANLSGYRDLDAMSPYAGDAMAWAVANGILRPQGDQLLPRGRVSRGEAAQVMAAMLVLMA